MDKETRADLAGGILKDLINRDVEGATDKAATIIAAGADDTMKMFEEFAQSLADVTRKAPGFVRGMDRRTAVLAHNAISRLAPMELINAVFAFAADRAKEINAARDYGRDTTVNT